jgi:hypothetical protein
MYILTVDNQLCVEYLGRSTGPREVEIRKAGHLWRRLYLPFFAAVIVVTSAPFVLPGRSSARPPEIPPLCTAGVITNTSPPTVSGTAAVGGVLTTSNGSWSPCASGIDGYTYQWFRDGGAIGGATSNSYTVVSADQCHGLRTTVTAYNEFGPSAPATSNTVSIPCPPPPPPACSNGVDDDGDGLVDMADPGCSSTSDTDEYNAPPPPPPATQCADGVDNDGDGLIDLNDAGCTDSSDNDEATIDAAPICGGTLGGGSSCAKLRRPPNFGGKYLDQNGNTYRGARAGIQAPASLGAVPYVTLAVMRVSAEAESRRSLIQVGFGLTKSQRLGSCGNSPADGYYHEYWETIISGSQDCRWRAAVPFGQSQLYAVYRRLSSATGNDTTWQANFNGSYRIDNNIGFDSAERIVAGGEFGSSAGGSFDRPDGRIEGCYGCSQAPIGTGPIGWQRTALAGSTGWTTIDSANNITDPPFTSSNRWIVDPLPGPFWVRHYCDGRHGC